jgi:hypothetical protein
MYGDVAINIPVDPAGGPPPNQPAQNIFRAGGRLQRERLTTISAVAVLSSINPTAIAVEQRIDERLDDDAELIDVVRVVRDEYARPDYDPNAYEGRLDTFHNMFAAETRLQRGIFAGPRDREFDVEGHQYTEVYRGPEFVGSP